MKELYTKPQTDVEEFKNIDVITTSAIDDNEPDTDIPWGS